ncbi:MAG TPA: hypothetical protein VMK83_11340, partial [Gaiellaceae bacterium]|nr:hypothetical protein [Gaiellaceae bacterium]
EAMRGADLVGPLDPADEILGNEHRAGRSVRRSAEAGGPGPGLRLGLLERSRCLGEQPVEPLVARIERVRRGSRLAASSKRRSSTSSLTSAENAASRSSSLASSNLRAGFSNGTSSTRARSAEELRGP